MFALLMTISYFGTQEAIYEIKGTKTKPNKIKVIYIY